MKIKNIIFCLAFSFICPCFIYASDMDVIAPEIVSASAEEIPADKLVFEQPLKPYSPEFYKYFVSAAYKEKYASRREAFFIFEYLYKSAPQEKAILASLSALSLEVQNKPAMEKYISAYYSLAPQDSSAMAMKAGLLWSEGKLNEAAELYKAALAKSPENPEIMTRYITLLTSFDGDEAVKYLKHLAEEYPGLASTIALNIADIYLKQGDTDSAIDYLEEHLKTKPIYPEPYLLLGEIYEKSSHIPEALSVYLDMVDLDIASPDIVVKIGAYYVLNDEKVEAMNFFYKAKEMDKSHPGATEFLVLDAQNRADFLSAARLLQESASYQKDPSFHIRASYFLSRADRRDESAELLKNAYTLFPEDKEVPFYYALSLIDLGDYKSAEKVLSSALQTSPDNEKLLFHYVYALDNQKKHKLMEKQLKKLLQLNPNNTEALNYYGYYLISKTRRIEEGGEYIKKAVSLDPKEPAFIDSLAWYYYKKGDYQQAYDLLNSISVEDLKALNDAEIYIHLAMATQALEKYEDSAFYYNLVLEKEPKNKIALKNLKKVTKKIKS